MNERTLAANVETLCKYLGVRYYHTWNSRNSVAGFPDYVFVTRDNRLLFRELKASTGRLTNAQADWIGALLLAGCSADTWYPSDWPDRIKAELTPQRVAWSGCE